jgi:HB1/ASXL restriction endonuclease-like protein with HTH domain
LLCYSERPDLDQTPLMRGYETPTDFSENGHDHGDREGQTYLRVAEIVLSKALSPLKAREIVERGIEQGLFGDHVMSRTPEKSMQARLSIDILSHGQNSRFARTSKGRFTLRSNLSTGRQGDCDPGEDSVEYLTKRRSALCR